MKYLTIVCLLTACGGSTTVTGEPHERDGGDQCGITSVMADGGSQYRCADGKTPTDHEGTEVPECALVTDNDGAGEALYVCPQSCVRFRTGDVNCSVDHGEWFLCPAGDDWRSAIGAPGPNCRFFTGIEVQGGRVAGYCCAK